MFWCIVRVYRVNYTGSESIRFLPGIHRLMRLMMQTEITAVHVSHWPLCGQPGRDQVSLANERTSFSPYTVLNVYLCQYIVHTSLYLCMQCKAVCITREKTMGDSQTTKNKDDNMQLFFNSYPVINWILNYIQDLRYIIIDVNGNFN